MFYGYTMRNTRQLLHCISWIFITTAVFLSGFSFAINRDNSNFIDDSFWTQSPTSGDIVQTLFGTTSDTGTAYTDHRENNTCDPSQIDVLYVWMNQIPTTLTGNTVYILTGWQTINDQLSFTGAWCTAVIGIGDSIYINPTGWFGYNTMIHINQQTGIILDNIQIGDNTNTVSYGIVIEDTTNTTIHNTFIDNFDLIGIRVLSSTHGHMHQIKAYNNHNGIEIVYSENQTIWYSYIFDNNQNGIYVYDSEDTIMQYNKLFNNNNYGISLNNTTHTYIYNVQSFNNQIWINAIDSTYFIIQENQIYNNNLQGIYTNNTHTGWIVNSMIYSQNIGLWMDDSTINMADTSFLKRGDIGIRLHNSTISHYNMEQYAGIWFINNNTNTLQDAVYIDNDSSFTTGIDTIQTQNILFSTWYILLVDRSTDGLCGIINTPIMVLNPWYQCDTIGTVPITINQPRHPQPILIAQWSHQYELHQPWSTRLIYHNQELIDVEWQDTVWFIADSPKFGHMENTWWWYINTNNYWSDNNLYVYTNQTQREISMRTKTGYTITYTISGDIQQINTGTIATWDNITNTTITLSEDDGPKRVLGYFDNTNIYPGIQSNYYLMEVYLDTTPPTDPILLSPLSWSMFTGDEITLLRNPSVDTGAWVSEYNYQVASDPSFTNILFAGSTTETGVLLTWSDVGYYPNYYRQVQAVDNLWQTSGRVTTGSFHYGFDAFDITISNTSFNTNDAQSVTITAYDIYGNIITGYNNEVIFTITGVSPTNPNAPYSDFTLPEDYQFTTADNGTVNFNNKLIITYPGIYQLTVQDTISWTQLGTTTQFTVSGEAPDMFSGTLEVEPVATSGAITIDFDASSYPYNYQLWGWAISPQSATNNNGSITITEDLTTLPNTDGSYDIVLIIDDGGFYTYTLTSTVILDTVAPVITIQNPTANSYNNINQPYLERSTTEIGAGMSGYIVVMSGESLVYTAHNQTNSGYRQGTPLVDGERTMTVYGYDNAANIWTASVSFIIDNTAPIIVSGSPDQVITQNPITFSWNVVETGGIDYSNFRLMDYYNNQIVTQTQVIWPATSISVLNLGLGTLAPGLYKWNVSVRDKVGLRWYNPNNEPFVFAVHNALPGQIQGFMEFQSSFGNVAQHNGNIYTNTTQVQAALFANMTSNVSLNGDINPNVSNVPLQAPFPYTLQAINLTPGEWTKNITALFTQWTLNPYSVAKQIILDTTDPTPPGLLWPINGETVSGDITFERSGASDDGAGIQTYNVQFAQDSAFNNPFGTRWVSNAAETLTINEGTFAEDETYYRRVITYDRVWNTSTSDTESFYIADTTTSVVAPENTVPNSFTLNTINNATPNVAYKSNTVTVWWLVSEQQALASVSAGTLFINGSASGTTWLVVNGDIVEIELIASQQYNTQISSTLGIGTRSASFNVRTINQQTAESYNGLTNTQKFQIRIIFDGLINAYGDNDSRTLSFFMTLRSAIEGMLWLNTLNNAQEDALEFFLTLINNYIDNIGGSNPFNGAQYNAKNGRVYTIVYDQVRTAYTSPEFTKEAYFASWTAMKRHIDIHNPWSLPGELIGNLDNLNNVNRGADVHVMPNGKIYRVEQKTNGKRYSPDTLSLREYDTLAWLLSWLRANNQSISHY